MHKIRISLTITINKPLNINSISLFTGIDLKSIKFKLISFPKNRKMYGIDVLPYAQAQTAIKSHCSFMKPV